MSVITTRAAVSTWVYLMTLKDYASCGTVATVLNKNGYTSLRGKKVSRMAVWRAMQHSEQGLNLLGRDDDEV